jgi:heme-degrading monooxygenase HmoA
MRTMIAKTPKPPYYAVIFTTRFTDDKNGYEKMASRMEELAKEQDGFLGLETVRKELGITVSFWKNLKAIKDWKNNLEHIEARKLGRSIWYKQFKLRICKVERDYGFKKE